MHGAKGDGRRNGPYDPRMLLSQLSFALKAGSALSPTAEAGQCYSDNLQLEFDGQRSHRHFHELSPFFL